MAKSEAARVFGVSRRALYNWLERAERGGAKALRGYLHSTQKMLHVVRNFFQEKHVRYAA